MVISAQISILNDSLKNIKLDAQMEFKKSSLGCIDKEKIINYIMNKKLLQCVRHHRLIIK